MKFCTNSFPRHSSLAHLIFLVVLALPVYAQTSSSADPYKKIALKTARPCTVGTSGELTSLVKNGVELSVNEDWDCDGIADAYDNCVGMPNPAQIDSDGDGIGDVCEAAVTIRAGVPEKSKSKIKAKSRKATVMAKSRSNVKAKSRKATAANKRSRPSVRRRRSL
jgi:thrombospondin type 3 repeat protein